MEEFGVPKNAVLKNDYESVLFYAYAFQNEGHTSFWKYDKKSRNLSKLFEISGEVQQIQAYKDDSSGRISYIGTLFGELIGIGEEGTILYRQRIDGIQEFTVSKNTGRIYVRCSYGKIVCYDKNGVLCWEFRIESCALKNFNIFKISPVGDNLLCLAAQHFIVIGQNGEIKQLINAASLPAYSPSMILSDKVLCLNEARTSLICLNHEGVVLWQKEFTGKRYQQILSDERSIVLVGLFQKNIDILDMEGNVLCSSVRNEIISIVSFGEDGVAVGYEGSLELFDRSGCKVAKIESDDDYSWATFDPDHVLAIASNTKSYIKEMNMSGDEQVSIEITDGKQFRKECSEQRIDQFSEEIEKIILDNYWFWRKFHQGKPARLVLQIGNNEEYELFAEKKNGEIENIMAENIPQEMLNEDDIDDRRDFMTNGELFWADFLVCCPEEYQTICITNGCTRAGRKIDCNVEFKSLAK